MKLSNRNRSTFLLFLGLGFLIGSLAWEVLERVLGLFGVGLSLSAGPIGLDLSVLKVSLEVNPGTVLGVIGGVVLFRLM
ncbi:MAG: hypothetical protein JW820_08925 [Spirochaetales bacterium]|nr:hypothetical protein [Spirochaetales bacterium]